MAAQFLPRLFVIGDSISIQYGPALERFIRGKFSYARKADEDFQRADEDLDVPAGANGGDSGMVLAYLRARRRLDPIKADVLLLNCGLHDIKTDPATGTKQVPLAQYRANLETILSETRTEFPRIIWVRTTPVFDDIHNSRSTSFHRFGRDVDAYNAAADQIMAGAGIPCVDLHGFSLSFLPEGFCDHVHFTESARELQAAFLAGALDAMTRDWPGV